MNHTIQQYVNEQSIRQYDAHREDMKWMNDQIKDLKRIIAVLCQQNDGEVVVYDNQMLHADPDAVLETERDARNRCVHIRLVACADVMSTSRRD